MNRARSFFFVSLGILSLAVAYHLGARAAHGQAATTIDGAHIYSPVGPNGSIYISGVLDRSFYLNGRPVAAPVPGTARVIATHAIDGFYMVVLENGDFYRGTESQWTYGGNLFGSPTPVQNISIGHLKAKYAPAALGK